MHIRNNKIDVRFIIILDVQTLNPVVCCLVPTLERGKSYICDPNLEASQMAIPSVIIFILTMSTLKSLKNKMSESAFEEAVSMHIVREGGQSMVTELKNKKGVVSVFRNSAFMNRRYGTLSGTVAAKFFRHNPLLSKRELEYTYGSKVLGTLPNELSFLFKSFEDSRYILKLKDNFDDKGSKKISKETWVSAIQFVIQYAKNVYDSYGIKILAPKIYHGPSGSIDVLWETDKYSLLMNIEENREAAFFASDNKNQKTKGTFSLHNTSFHLLPIAVSL